MNARELTVQWCEACGQAFFPRRLTCAACAHATAGTDTPAGPGTVVDVVELYLIPGSGTGLDEERPRFALVHLDAGPRVLARIDAAVAQGSRVRLEINESGAIVASDV